MKRRLRVTMLAASLLGGGTVLQFGSCAASAINLGLAATDFCALINFVSGGTNCSIGPFVPCGVPNIQVIDENGFPVGPTLFTEDDLLLDCPVTFVLQPENGG
jgi:hypothetical protein